MKLPKMKWPVVIITLAVTLPLLFAGYWFWQRHTINRPLADQLQEVPGIREVQLATGRSRLQIRLVAETAIDFTVVAPKIQTLVDETAKGADIVWNNQPDGALAETRQSLDFILREAQIRHEYVSMQQRVADRLQQSGIVYQLGVDERFIYLKLQQGEQVWLEMLPVIRQGGAAE